MTHSPHPTEPNMPPRFFVYGTLKRSQCRAGLWPARAIDVVVAWTPGRLFGRDDYPAMLPGDDRVLGEVWTFNPSDIAAVIERLDAIEGTGRPGQPDLYVRVMMETFDRQNRSIGMANAYHYARDPSADGFVRIESNEFVHWP